eukprot:scaffold12189_cov104-Isochrysis_galbana.AAC.5
MPGGASQGGGGASSSSGGEGARMGSERSGVQWQGLELPPPTWPPPCGCGRREPHQITSGGDSGGGIDPGAGSSSGGGGGD